eukprot:4721794-Pleurochrysis_carterae.AAC.1
MVFCCVHRARKRMHLQQSLWHASASHSCYADRSQSSELHLHPRLLPPQPGAFGVGGGEQRGGAAAVHAGAGVQERAARAVRAGRSAADDLARGGAAGAAARHRLAAHRARPNRVCRRGIAAQSAADRPHHRVVARTPHHRHRRRAAPPPLPHAAAVSGAPRLRPATPTHPHP